MNSSLSYERPGSVQRDTSSISPRMRLLLFLLFGFGILLMGTTLWFAIARPVKVVPRIKPLPAFQFEDQYGLPLNSSDLLGRQVLINFTYTNCGETCAAQRQGLIRLREKLRAEGRLGSEVIFLTLSIDPVRDTREALQIYAVQLGADRENWRIVTGNADELKALIGGELSIYYAKPDASGKIEHEQEVILVDNNGIFRARYKAETLEQSNVLRDIGMITEEMGSSGMMRQVYEASHLFLCYPPD